MSSLDRVQELLRAAQLSQTSYLRPDDQHVRRVRRFWSKKKAHAEAPLDAKQAARVERQRKLMNTGSAEPTDTAQPE